ncbi:CapA family protein [Streptococcus loxodontisalivarius]|uniref:Poly-gamma-glutamate synthesis protein (Capsule biosynthesis protein) n=1 Tax=Streptococcus loxodontisalivarius TaxID=1349415 RepID=A0ABS2PR20_9STRE|nr:CapA family protein [Streptococcus loxodontisalivarius]MBM7642440.1 poly-gamma-glutamate synthesis protein (capsule biosynthesis protein) [Streptococcus loxodontisalivarius]
MRFLYQKTSLACLGVIGLAFLAAAYSDFTGQSTQQSSTSNQETTSSQTARVVANGDILLHDILYTSALQADGSYQFDDYFQYAKDWISSADLAIGDYEGTISPDYPLAGYPLFNAPAEIATTLKDTGYDVIDLAHNHILDSGLSGAINTAQTFESLGLSTIGVYKEDRASEDILIKEVNGIKIAILGYAYGYNGNDASLTTEEYEAHMSDLDEAKIQADLEKAEQEADVTIVMPQMGVEYQRTPTDEQVTLYHKMVDWGADVIFGGHPHVAEPSETLEKDGQQKFIIYSMGNFISNQREETVDDIWTERGLLMDVTFEKTGNQTIIKTVQAHPTMTWSWGKGTYDATYGYEYRDYRAIILEDFIEGGQYRDLLDDNMKSRVDTAYTEMNELVNLQWK